MEEPLRNIENKVNELLTDLLKVDAVQEALYNVLDIHGSDKTNIAKICLDLQTVLTPEEPTQSDAPPPANSEAAAQKVQEQKDNIQRVHDVGIKTLVKALSRRNNPSQSQQIANILHTLTNNKVVSAKTVCFALLASESLKPDHAVFWLTSFKLIKKIIPGVDYKGVREIMKSCLERAWLLSPHLRHSQLPQTDAICKLLEMIFDRNSSLLPGYFIVNELLKLYPDYKTWPHWRLSRMLTGFVDDFRKAAQMLTIVGRHKLRPIVEHSGHTSPSINSWKIDSTTLKFPLKGALPYLDTVQKPQPGLLFHIFKQPYSKDMIGSILDVQKKVRYPVLENQLCILFEESLKECEAFDLAHKNATNVPIPAPASEENASGPTPPPLVPPPPSDLPIQCQCGHLTSLLINFVLNQLISFKSFVQALHDRMKLRDKPPAARGHLMWTLLQYLSGTIAKNPVSEFNPLIRLIELLYPEKEPLPIPDYTDQSCALQLSAMCILIHILRKAQSDNLKIPQSLPPAFTGHNDLLQNLVHNPQVPMCATGFPTSSTTTDYRIGLLLNAYSTNQEVFHRPMWGLTEVIQGSQKTTVPMPGSNCVAYGSTAPLKMSFLDSLTIHVKMSILQNISQHITKQAHNKSAIALAPALIETYARLVVYSEIETIAVKQYINIHLPVVYKNQTWGQLHALLEMFTYRIHHSSPQYRINLLSTIHHMAAPLNNMPNMNQLHLCMESSALRLITGLGNAEVMPSLTRFFSTDSKPNIISPESEELNRVIVLTMARAIHVTGCDNSGESARWCMDFLKAIMTPTPHTWAMHTLQCFPQVISDFYKQHGAPRDIKNLQNAVEEEYRKWKSMSNENDIIAHFSLQHNTSNLFLCLLFKMVLETTRVPVEAYKVLERLGPRQLMSHIRTLCDFLVLEFSNSSVNSQHISKCVSTMNAIMWQFNIVPIDRLILCLALRTQEGTSEAQVCLFIIQLLLLKTSEFRNRVQELVQDNSPEHWRQTNWYEKHMAFHRKYPEKFSPESIMAGQSSLSSQHQTLPIYFSNVCLRFLPVLDIMIHRFLEVHQVHKRLEAVLEQIGALYKFHDRPITYLYNTFHYYEERLRESFVLKRHLVNSVVMSQKDIRPKGWALTEDYLQYLPQKPEEQSWVPGLAYYSAIVKRMVKTMQGDAQFPPLEWRFNEFANVGAHALHVTCVELMALPINPSAVANMLIDTLLKGYYSIDKKELMEWVNTLGLILSWLPEAYWIVIHDRIVALLQIPELCEPFALESCNLSPFTLMDLQALSESMCNIVPPLTLALAHSFWHHASFGQVGRIPILMRERIRPILKTEEQLVVLYHLVAPFLQRFNTEMSRKVFDVTVELYQSLATVDRQVTTMHYEDPICDLLYHIKYMFTGDTIKNDLDRVIRGLRPSLRTRLRFITHLNIEAIQNGSCSSVGTSSSVVSTTTSAINTSSTTSISSSTGTATVGHPIGNQSISSSVGGIVPSAMVS